ncbi:MAG: hypothetical protein PHV34_08685 [Verrucomicrobiae bacterium]|nr:hypothetical protein [Verrucomicrobiae bacterium]
MNTPFTFADRFQSTLLLSENEYRFFRQPGGVLDRSRRLFPSLVIDIHSLEQFPKSENSPQTYVIPLTEAILAAWQTMEAQNAEEAALFEVLRCGLEA